MGRLIPPLEGQIDLNNFRGITTPDALCKMSGVRIIGLLGSMSSIYGYAIDIFEDLKKEIDDISERLDKIQNSQKFKELRDFTEMKKMSKKRKRERKEEEKKKKKKEKEKEKKEKNTFERVEEKKNKEKERIQAELLLKKIAADKEKKKEEKIKEKNDDGMEYFNIEKNGNNLFKEKAQIIDECEAEEKNIIAEIQEIENKSSEERLQHILSNSKKKKKMYAYEFANEYQYSQFEEECLIEKDIENFKYIVEPPKEDYITTPITSNSIFIKESANED